MKSENRRHIQVHEAFEFRAEQKVHEAFSKKSMKLLCFEQSKMSISDSAVQCSACSSGNMVKDLKVVD